MATGSVTHHDDGTLVFESEATGRWARAKRRDSFDRRPASWHVVYSDGRQWAGEWDRYAALFQHLSQWVMEGRCDCSTG